MNATDKALEQEIADAQVIDEPPMLADLEPGERLAFIAEYSGDLTAFLTEDQLTAIGGECVADYEQDDGDREEWLETAKRAIKAAAQKPNPEKLFPWKGASNVNFPLLATAAMQFHARAYPAIVKGDEAVICKVVGRDRGQPVIGPDGQQALNFPLKVWRALVQAAEDASTQAAEQGIEAPVLPTPIGIAQDKALFSAESIEALPEATQEAMAQGLEPAWQVPPGAKASRAQRVREYMNTTIFYRMKSWEADTDALLQQLPVVGCAFRKQWPEGEEQRSAFVSALNVVAPITAKDCETAPRLTEVRDDQSYNDVIGDMRAGRYRTVALVKDENDAAPRKLLEQYTRIDLDDDGYAEPYIVTIDHESRHVLRIEANFGPQSVTLNDQGQVAKIVAGKFWTKYDFLPDLEGGFYGMGLGHILEQIGGIVDRAINQLIDAGAAQVAGGGFIASGVDLQGAGRRSSRLLFTPGEYKTVSATGAQLRDAIYERTWPGPSQVMFSVLDMMLGAAKDIASVKDVLTGEASNNGQVGTTLALIEQGLQVFTAIYKRVYRSLKDEFTILFENMSRYGGQAMAEDYARTLDDPEADFARDFDARDLDIRPISDPTSVTRLQKMARAQFLMQFVAAPGVNPQAIYKRVWEAADIDDIDELMAPPQPPPPPNPKDVASAEASMAKANLDTEKAETERQNREMQALQNLAAAFGAGQQVGMA